MPKFIGKKTRRLINQLTIYKFTRVVAACTTNQSESLGRMKLVQRKRKECERRTKSGRETKSRRERWVGNRKRERDAFRTEVRKIRSLATARTRLLARRTRAVVTNKEDGCVRAFINTAAIITECERKDADRLSVRVRPASTGDGLQTALGTTPCCRFAI